MSSQTMTADVFVGGDSSGNVRGWVIFAGIASMLLGIAAIVYDGPGRCVRRATDVRRLAADRLCVPDPVLERFLPVSPGRDHPRDGRDAARGVSGIRRAGADARPVLLFHRRRSVQDLWIDRSPV